mgnify:CR=1 FL=1|tara:strand:+ start:15174 stop:15437 length:264 start_codon:yes stop_codon:yes gene_type:complete
MFNCVLCEEQTCYVSKFCDNCRVIKNIGNCYGYVEIKNVLEKVCIRNIQQRQYKIDDELKTQIEKEDKGDETYMKPKTRNYKTKEEK